tara:strand:- start:373 stop:522 length:150 start_codon:yes stop_codon:yes gene_type:complete
VEVVVKLAVSQVLWELVDQVVVRLNQWQEVLALQTKVLLEDGAKLVHLL